MIHGIHWFPQPQLGRSTWVGDGFEALKVQRCELEKDVSLTSTRFEGFVGSVIAFTDAITPCEAMERLSRLTKPRPRPS